MEYEIFLTSIAIAVLVVVATSKSALDELSDVSLRLLASEHQNSPRGTFLRSVVDNLGRFSFTITFGIHLAISSIAILITSLTFKLGIQHFLTLSFGLVVLTLILVRLVLPLLLTQNDPSRTLLFLRYPLKLVYPPLSLVGHPIYSLLRGLQREETPEEEEEDEEEDSESELQALLDVGEEEGIIEEDEGEMIQSIIRFSDRTAGEVMTPRTKIIAVEASTSLEAVRDIMIDSKYSRLPVYREQIDQIEGIIYVRDLLSYWAKGEGNQTAIELARPTYFIPETKPTDELLREMQKAKAQMAMVIDEYGGIAGLITLEDLVEEIVGEIEDEDEPEPNIAEQEVSETGEGEYLVRGDVEIGKIERLYDAELAADDFSTVAGLVINQLGHLPEVGEKLFYNGIEFEIAEADERRISKVLLRRLQNEGQTTEEQVLAVEEKP